MKAIQSETTLSRRRPTRVPALALALTVVGFGAAAAAAFIVTRDRPNPRESAAVNSAIGSASPAAGAHLAGWRPELSAERVRCVLPGGTVDTVASEFPLQGLLTRERIATECATGNDVARSAGALPASSAMLCATASSDFYPMPVVHFDGSACSVHPGLRDLTDTDLATLNRLRAFDVAFLAVPSSSDCPTVDQATEWTKARMREYGGGLTLQVVDTDAAGDACYRATVDWERRTVFVAAMQVPPPTGGR